MTHPFDNPLTLLKAGLRTPLLAIAGVLYGTGSNGTDKTLGKKVI
jgi:hypothetical protein